VIIWKVIILPGAEADIDGIYNYIAAVLMEPMTAGKLVARIKKAILSLDHIPERHRLYDNEPWRSKGLRMFPVGNYIVFFHMAPDISKVFIDSVIYGGRDIDAVLEERLSGN